MDQDKLEYGPMKGKYLTSEHMQPHRYVTFDAHVHTMPLSRLTSGWRWLQSKHTLKDKDLLKPWEMSHVLAQNFTQGYFNFFFPVFPGTSRLVNEWNDGYCSGNGVALPFLSVHPEDGPREIMALLKEFIFTRRFAGLKIHSYVQGIPLDLPWLKEVCALLQSERRILFVHSGFAQAFGFGDTYNEEAMAEHLDTILSTYPKLTVVAAHMLYPRLDLASQLLETYPNLWMDTANVMENLQDSDRIGAWLQQWEVHAERILFGSDFGLSPYPLYSVVERFESLPLSERALHLIGGETARWLLSTLNLLRTTD